MTPSEELMIATLAELVKLDKGQESTIIMPEAIQRFDVEYDVLEPSPGEWDCRSLPCDGVLAYFYVDKRLAFSLENRRGVFAYDLVRLQTRYASTAWTGVTPFPPTVETPIEAINYVATMWRMQQ